MTQTLDTVLTSSYACLAEGAADPGSVWHTPTLANIDTEGRVSLRSVVLRGWNPSVRCLEIHTDTRSDKVTALSRDPHASLHVWDAKRRVQLRVSGEIGLHVGDRVAEAAWARLKPPSRATYGVLPGPGSTLPDPAATSQADEAAGFAVFCVMRLTIHALEWLHLEQGSHARARFRWDNGVPIPMWLVP